jgi:hypothetical protein
VVDAINSVLVVEFPIDDPAKLAVLETEFRSRSRKSVWRGCVAVVDGVHFAMLSPGFSVHNANKFFVGRKN